MKVRGSSDRPLDQPSLSPSPFKKERRPKRRGIARKLAHKQARYRNDPPFFHPSEN
jgi:hypothetical protein